MLERHLAESTARLERTEAERVAAEAAREAAEERARVLRSERDTFERDQVAARAEAARQGTHRQEEQAARAIRIEAFERTADEIRAAHRLERNELIARLEEHEARRADIATTLARAEERLDALADALAVRAIERDDARNEARSLRTRLKAVTEARDTLEAERIASARESETAVLLERLVADDRTGRVHARVGAVEVGERPRRRAPEREK